MKARKTSRQPDTRPCAVCRAPCYIDVCKDCDRDIQARGDLDREKAKALVSKAYQARNLAHKRQALTKIPAKRAAIDEVVERAEQNLARAQRVRDLVCGQWTGDPYAAAPGVVQ